MMNAEGGRAERIRGQGDKRTRRDCKLRIENCKLRIGAPLGAEEAVDFVLLVEAFVFGSRSAPITVVEESGAAEEQGSEGGNNCA